MPSLPPTLSYAGPGSNEARETMEAARRASRAAILARLRMRLLLMMVAVGGFGVALSFRRPYAADIAAVVTAGSLLYVVLIPIGMMRTGWPAAAGVTGAVLFWAGVFSAICLRASSAHVQLGVVAALGGAVLFALASYASRNRLK